ncbi:uncharacterized protein LOC141789387 [Halichoeres trimaculatus]|uniref:uncharacterized protein LOC141789387 n=1 Tax=Halichoeres trimaculatus TaxID=147232 RepID=UPI003D9F8AD1
MGRIRPTLMPKPFMPLVVLVLGLTVHLHRASASAEEEKACGVTSGPDGVTYELLHPSPPPGAKINWETGDKTSIARGVRFLPDQVVNVTNNSITLKNCTDELHATWGKSGAGGEHTREEATCRANCSAVLNQRPPQPIVNSTQWCLFKGFCGWKAVLCIVGIVGIVTLGLSAAAFWLCRRKRAPCNTPYTPANKGEVEMEPV